MQQKKIILDDWQEEALNYKGHILLCTGRQIGKTMILSRKICKRMVEEPGTRIVVASLTEDQAKLIIIMVQDYLRTNHKSLTTRLKKAEKWTQNRASTNNGSWALARPVGNTGDAVRGFTADILVLDEVSRFNKLIMTAAKPTLLSTGGEIWMASTPYGRQGFFWEQFDIAYNKKNPKARFKVIYKSSADVIYNRPVSESWDAEAREDKIRFLEEEKASCSTMEYGQEYLGLFLEELMQYFPDELITKACVLKRRNQTLRERTYSLGVDIARYGKDASAFSILDRINEDVLEQVEFQLTHKTSTVETENKILQLNRQYDEIEKIYIDAGSGSLGVGIFDHLLKEDETKRKVVAINNRQIVLDSDGKRKQRLLKEDLYDNLRNLLETGKLKLLDDENIVLSLKSVQYEYINDEKGPSKLRIFSNFNDPVESLIRAAWIVKEENLNIWIDSIRV